jgi:hypothetical protein
MTRALRCAALSIVCLASRAGGQAGNDTAAFTVLRPDGNGIAALSTMIGTGFGGWTAGEALTGIAKQAKLNITFDPHLLGIRTLLPIGIHQRTAAVALIEVGKASQLRIRVSRDGNIVVDAAPEADPRPIVADSTPRRPVILPPVVTEAGRQERVDFNTRANLGGLSIAGASLTATPSFVEPDLLRSIQLLPGIEARSDYSAAFNARGGEADQNLILLDGYPIYSPFHLGGVFSTFIDPTVGQVDLYTGGLPVRFGGRLSSVLDVHSADPQSRSLSGTVEASLVSTTASVGRAFGDDGSWVVAARRTYADAVVTLFQPNRFPYHFGDVQGHLTHSLGQGVRLSVTAYDGVDAVVGSAGDEFGGSWGNAVAGATLSKSFDDHPSIGGWSLGDSVVVAQQVSITRFLTRLAVPNGLLHVDNHVSDFRIGGSVTSTAGSTTRTLGYEVASQRLTYSANAGALSLGDIFPLDSLGQRIGSASVYSQQSWRPWSNVLIEGGARFDDVPADRWAGVSSRLSLKYFWHPNIAFSIGGGSYAQWLHSLGHEEAPIEPIQVWVAGDSSLPVSRSRDAVVGVERWVTPSRLLHVAAFYKRYDHLLLPNSASAPDVPGSEFFDSRGTSYGVDVLLRQLDGGPFSGWLAYSYALSSRIDANGVRYAPTQDRRHDLNLVGKWRTDGGWNLGARLNLASGMPYTTELGGYVQERYDPLTQRWGPDNATTQQIINGPFNGSRLPWYDRLDVSATYNGQFHGAAVSPYFSVINVFNAKNPAAYLYSFDGHPDRASFPNLPFAPTFGVTIVY